MNLPSFVKILYLVVSEILDLSHYLLDDPRASHFYVIYSYILWYSISSTHKRKSM